CAVSLVRLRDDGRDAPEEILRLLHRLPLLVLHEIALLENGPSVGRQSDGAAGWIEWKSHRRLAWKLFSAGLKCSRPASFARRIWCSAGAHAPDLSPLFFKSAASAAAENLIRCAAAAENSQSVGADCI